MDKVAKRIRANRIVGYIRFRDHCCSNPGRHSWDLCGEPMYYWALKAAAEVKYLEKIVLYTEVEEAWARAKKLSDKFVVAPRTIEECRNPEWMVVDDLKTPNSRKSVYSDGIDKRDDRDQSGFVERVTGIEYPVVVGTSAAHPLTRSKTVERLIERYFEHDSAEAAVVVVRAPTHLLTQNLAHPEFLWPVWYEHHTVRQNYPPLYQAAGIGITTYQNVGRRHTVFVEEPWEEGLDVHDKKDLDLVRFYMEKRLNK